MNDDGTFVKVIADYHEKTAIIGGLLQGNVENSFDELSRPVEMRTNEWNHGLSLAKIQPRLGLS
jgi:hypothetical protein